jgi:hypothetical protein
MTNRNAVRKGVNTTRIRRVNANGGVIAFNYRAANSEAGEAFQHVVAKVEPDSLVEYTDGTAVFTALNINRLTGEVDSGFRTYRVDRITNTVEIV